VDVIKDFVVQWQKMKEALERQQERLMGESLDGAPLDVNEYQTRISRIIDQLDQLLKAHDDTNRP
jgi:hypothetical protein